MEKITIKLLQDYGDYKSGKTFKVGKEDGEKLIEDSIAELYVPVVKLEEAEDAAKVALDEVVKKLVADVKLPSFEVVEDEADKPVFKTAGEFYQHVRQHGIGNPTEKMIVYIGKAPAGNNTIFDTEGGFLVPEEFSTQLMASVEARAVLAPRTTQLKINRMIKLPYVDDFNKNTSWFGGITAAWTNEAGTISDSKIKFRQVSLELQKLAALLYVTDELMDDSAVAVETLINVGAAEVIAKEFDDAIVVGSGAGKPLGILSSPALVTVSKETGQAAATFNFKNALKMWQRVNNKANAVWLMNRDVLPEYYQFAQIVGTGGGPVTVVNAVTRLPEQLFGAPIIETPHCKTLGTLGDIILTDLSQYLTATKAGGTPIKSASSIHVKFTTDEIAFRFTFRADGQSWWKSAVTQKNGSNTVSPFVVLAART